MNSRGDGKYQKEYLFKELFLNFKLMTYLKDTGNYREPKNFSGTFGNSCKYIYKDGQGEYVYDAVSFDFSGYVTFNKRYLK